jgi:pimeloyl-ACP methyl ester carboxylesterase
VIVWLLMVACSDDAFHVRRDGADLPVWREGPPDASVTLVVQHGSGASGAVYANQPAFDTLEEDVSVVYWEQRVAGVAQGDPPLDGVGMDASVDDLALVLDATRTHWGPERIVLLGHSLGGGLSQALLVDQPGGIDGYIDVSGGRSLPEAYGQARARITAACADAGWADCTAFYADRPTFPRDDPDRATHAGWADRVLERDGYDQAAVSAAMTSHLTRAGLHDTLFASFDALAFAANAGRFTRRFDLDAGALTPDDVASIDLPTLFIAGRHDLAVPLAHTEASVAAFGGNDPRSRLVVLEGGHFPMWDDPDGFAASIEDFLSDL